MSVSSRPHQMTMGKREFKQISPAVFRLRGQSARGPREVEDQSNCRTRADISGGAPEGSSCGMVSDGGNAAVRGVMTRPAFRSVPVYPDGKFLARVRILACETGQKGVSLLYYAPLRMNTKLFVRNEK